MIPSRPSPRAPAGTNAGPDPSHAAYERGIVTAAGVRAEHPRSLDCTGRDTRIPWFGTDRLAAVYAGWFDRPMKNKGLGERFGRNLRSFWVTRRSLGDRGGPWSGSCEVDVAAVGRDRRDRGRFLRADDPRRGCRRRQLALGCARARADDVSKSRRQELVVCRATCVLLVSDLIYARSSVTLAPAFLAGAPACWSWTSRW